MKKLKKIALISSLVLGGLTLFIFGPLAFGTRPLNTEETKIAKAIFGSSIDLESVKIKEGSPLTWVYPGVTIGHTIAFPKNSYSSSDLKDQALLIHELTHVWQYENIGWTYAPRALFEELTQADAYVVHYNPNKAFINYDLEEQAEILAEYHLTGEAKFKQYLESLNLKEPSNDSY